MSKNRTENIFNKYSTALKAFISKNISSNNESEDILHDIFYKFIITDGDEEIIENVSSWLYRVARNIIIDRSRKIKDEEMPYLMAKERDALLEIPLSDLLSDEQSSPETDFISKLIKEELTIALSQLPKEQRNVFELHELQGVSFKEISEATSTPINTLISQKRYAVVHLRSRLKKLYDDISS